VRLAPRKNLPYSGASSEAGGCYDAFFNVTNEWSQWVPRKEGADAQLLGTTAVVRSGVSCHPLICCPVWVKTRVPTRGMPYMATHSSVISLTPATGSGSRGRCRGLRHRAPDADYLPRRQIISKAVPQPNSAKEPGSGIA
jgi:hypothetical protein